MISLSISPPWVRPGNAEAALASAETSSATSSIASSPAQPLVDRAHEGREQQRPDHQLETHQEKGEEERRLRREREHVDNGDDHITDCRAADVKERTAERVERTSGPVHGEQQRYQVCADARRTLQSFCECGPPHGRQRTTRTWARQCFGKLSINSPVDWNFTEPART